LVSLGIFGSRYDPRVIWIGIHPYDELVRIMKIMQEQLIPLGYIPDRQNLVPHLTLGRIKGLKDKALFQQTVDRFRDLSSREMQVNSFILYESILKKEGPVYIALQTFHLSK
jgi:2'-5' RNA ligase